MVWALPNIDNIEIYRVRTWQVALGGDGKMKDFVLGLALLPMVHSVLAKIRSVCVFKTRAHFTHTIGKETVVNTVRTLERRPW